MKTEAPYKSHTNGRAAGDEPNVAAGVSSLAHDAIELAELQTQLLVLDVKAATAEARASMIFIVVAACLLLGCIPVALFALAEFFVAYFDWSRAASLAVAALIGVVSSAGAAAAAWSRFRIGLDSLKRSREEFSRNLAWIKSNLRRSKPSPPATKPR
jgi:hypothetical protein